jgi:hypothetical protein
VKQGDFAKVLSLFSDGLADPELVSQLTRDRRETVARRWSSWWDRNPRLGCDWARLTPAQRERISSAPEVWTLLAGVHYGEADLAKWIAAESESRGWSASGEMRDGEKCAIRLESNTIVDWQSPATLATIPDIHGEPASICPKDASEALAKIRDAVEILKVAAPRWVALMREFDAVLLLRSVPALADFNSATTRLAVGRPVFRNAHLPGASPELLADALVHETVHTVLDHIELTCPLVTDEYRFAGATIASGWTGKELDLNTFIHACMVWFANFHVWLNAARFGAIDFERNVKMLSSRSRGFFARPARQLERFGEALAPGVLEMVANAECQVLELIG